MEQIIEDFEYDLEAGRNASWLSFAFRDLIICNEEYKAALFEEFKELPTHPKYHWFYQGKIKDGHITDDELKRWENKYEEDVIYADVERKLESFIAEFHNKVRNNSIEKNHYGRNVLNTATVKILNQINSKFVEFEKFVSREHKESYQVYASAFASEIIALTNKLNIQGLKEEILNKFIDESGNTDIVISLIYASTYYNTEKLRSEYEVLKIYANKLFRDELERTERLTGEQRFFIDYARIEAIYRLCEDEFFKEPFTKQEMVNCFDLNYKANKHPKFNRGFQAKFKYILAQINDKKRITNIDKIALERFGIKGYYNINHTPSKYFKADVSNALK
jgi:hypothetical protein